MLKFHVFLLIQLSVLLCASGQKSTVYFPDVATYPNKVSELIGDNITVDDEKQMFDFMDFWKKNVFSNNRKEHIVSISNTLFDRKARGPYFKSFVFFLTRLQNSEKDSINYETLLQFITSFVSEKKNTLNGFASFIQNISDLYEKNYLHNSTSIKWINSRTDFKYGIQQNIIFVSFPEGDITCYSKHDSIKIMKTTGKYYPIENKWDGSGGNVTWERAGYKPETVNALLNIYHIELNHLEYTADSVIFTYSKYFSHPVTGKLKDKVMEISDPEAATYPEFDSYSKRFIFKDLYENIDYDGGFSMRGAKIIGSGNATEDAIISVKSGTKILMTVKSKFFVFHPDIINGINTTVKINLETDSIFHPDLNFTYLAKLKEVDLVRGESFSSRSPYLNSYHKVDMDFEQLTWKIDQPKINLTMARGSTIGKARFESVNYFKQEQFDKLQGMDNVHPLVSIKKYSRVLKSDHFIGANFADYVGFPVSEVRQELMLMAQKGFIYYNGQTDVVTLKKRLSTYLSSSAGSVDYDVVDFVSNTQAPLDNTELNMNNFDLTINGIKQVAASDSQNVVIYPTGDRIIVKENRSFQFDGKVEAGLFTFYGSNFFFNYPEFKINLQNVDSVSINVFTGEVDNFGRPVKRKVNNVIQHLTGEIQLDKPDNKSGRKSLKEYPRFASRENSYVYYQSKEIENGVYSKDNFYFELYPFILDSLNSFKKEGMVFDGKFQSAGILPPIEQKLALQEDYSLGFKYNSRTAGIPVYDAKAILYADIQLSNKGLRGGGKLNYITSTTTSKEFKFYPDSMNTKSDNFVIAEKTTAVEYPPVKSDENYIHWMTKQNRMYLKQGKAPFWAFNDQTNISGKLFLDPQGLSATGTMNLTTADINSKLFRYKAHIIDADTSKFLLKSLTKAGYTVLTEENVSAHIDFVKQKGEFTANEDYTKVEFPENKYISFLDYFKWNMDEKTLEMGASRPKISNSKQTERATFEEKYSFENEPVGPRYISLNTKQDSLNFVAPKAIYDYQKNLINAFNVKLIRVADAVVYPGDGKVIVAEAAQMRTLFDAKVVANFVDTFHTIHSANMNIFGRNNFTGSGKYDYADENGNIQTITLNDIRVDTALHTIGKGSILETDSFKLSPYFSYQGKVILHSMRPLLNFDGGVTFTTDCDRPRPSWLKFESEIDPKDVFIPVNDNPVNINNNKVFTGFLLGSDSIHTYPAFISGRRNYNDTYILSSAGYLHFNRDSMFYEMGSKEKMQFRDSMGNYVNLRKEGCLEYGEGEIQTGISLGQVKLASYGDIKYDLTSKEMNLDAVLSFDFMLNQPALAIMANEIDSFPSLSALNIRRTVLTRSLTELMGIGDATNYLKEMTLGKPKIFPQEMQHTLNFSELHLKWNAKTNSYESQGKLGIGSILNHQINRMVDGYIELIRRRSGDFMNIYLKLDDKHFYYFGYTHGVMQVYSSNNDFLESMRNLSLKQRQLDVPKSQPSYIYMITAESTFGQFLRRYRNHLKGEAPAADQQEQEELPVESPGENPQVKDANPKANDDIQVAPDDEKEPEVKEVK